MAELTPVEVGVLIRSTVDSLGLRMPEFVSQTDMSEDGWRRIFCGDGYPRRTTANVLKRMCEIRGVKFPDALLFLLTRKQTGTRTTKRSKICHTSPKRLGKAIRKFYRDVLGYNRTGFARQIEKGPERVLLWEKGESVPSLPALLVVQNLAETKGVKLPAMVVREIQFQQARVRGNRQVADAIREFRETCGYSIDEWAARLGTSPSAARSWERCAAFPRHTIVGQFYRVSADRRVVLPSILMDLYRHRKRFVSTERKAVRPRVATRPFDRRVINRWPLNIFLQEAVEHLDFSAAQFAREAQLGRSLLSAIMTHNIRPSKVTWKRIRQYLIAREQPLPPDEWTKEYR